MSLEETNQLKEYFDAKFDQLNAKMDKFDRGMYGEEENENPGVMKRLKVVEIKVAKVFNFKNRVAWIGVGVAIGVSIIWKVVETFIA